VAAVTTLAQFPSVVIPVPEASQFVPPATGAIEKPPPTPQLITLVAEPLAVTTGEIIVLPLRAAVPVVSVNVPEVVLIVMLSCSWNVPPAPLKDTAAKVFPADVIAVVPLVDVNVTNLVAPAVGVYVADARSVKVFPLMVSVKAF